MLAVGNFRDWHAAVGEVPWSTDEQSRQACAAPAAESSASADHATAVKDNARVSGFPYCSQPTF